MLKLFPGRAYWNQRKVWCVSVDGKKPILHSDRDEAHRLFHAIMAKPKGENHALVASRDRAVSLVLAEDRPAGRPHLFREVKIGCSQRRPLSAVRRQTHRTAHRATCQAGETADQ